VHLSQFRQQFFLAIGRELALFVTGSDESREPPSTAT
jgi:hypothetical protein